MTNVKASIPSVLGDSVFQSSNAKFEKLRNTLSLGEIDRAVYSDDLSENQCVVRNNNLTEEHCRHLSNRLEKDDDLSWALLVWHKSFPEDLLPLVALNAGELTQSFILARENVPPEVRVIIALKPKS